MTDAPDQVHLVGGGIASLAAAVFLIRDASVDGNDIHILEGSSSLGGSLDGSGDERTGFVIRGERMFEEHFGCTFDLLRAIPTLDGSSTVTQEILEFTREVLPSSNCRLVVICQ